MTPGTFEWIYGSKTVILPTFGHLVNLVSDLSVMLNTAPISFSDWQKFLSGIYELRCSSNTAFLTIFGYVMTATFHLWTSNSQKCLTLPHLVFLVGKKSYLVHLNGVKAPKLNFCPYLVMWLFCCLTFGTPIFINAWHFPSKSFPLTKIPAWYICMELRLQSGNFGHIWSCSDLDLWPVDPKI